LLLSLTKKKQLLEKAEPQKKLHLFLNNKLFKTKFFSTVFSQKIFKTNNIFDFKSPNHRFFKKKEEKKGFNLLKKILNYYKILFLKTMLIDSKRKKKNQKYNTSSELETQFIINF